MQSSKLFAGKIERFIQNIVKAEERKAPEAGTHYYIIYDMNDRQNGMTRKMITRLSQAGNANMFL